MEALFWSFVGAVSGSMLTMLLSHVSAIATARRASYSSIGANLVSLWRDGQFAKTNEILIELAKLAVDGNRDLNPEIILFMDSLRAGSSDAQDYLVRLLDKMRKTAFLANVRESFATAGASQADLLQRLIEY
ncbi:hypothetical protein ACLN6N_07270 [Sphingomonas carotinifaciens]|uniref:hypothetical protein n=1 Tax=Sphingomonas carotinifaciens TaxID=1166323 RepID=UPI0039A36941